MPDRFDPIAAKVAAERFHTRKAAQMLGRKGGLVKSPAKTAAVRENGKLGGGRPKTAPAKIGVE